MWRMARAMGRQGMASSGGVARVVKGWRRCGKPGARRGSGAGGGSTPRSRRWWREPVGAAGSNHGGPSRRVPPELVNGKKVREFGEMATGMEGQ